MKTSNTLPPVKCCDYAKKPHLCTNVNRYLKASSNISIHSGSVLDLLPTAKEIKRASALPTSSKNRVTKQKSNVALQKNEDSALAQEMEIWKEFRMPEKENRTGPPPDVATVNAGGFKIQIPTSPPPPCTPSSSSSSFHSLDWNLHQYEDVTSTGYGTPTWNPKCVKRRPNLRCCQWKEGKTGKLTTKQLKEREQQEEDFGEEAYDGDMESDANARRVGILGYEVPTQPAITSIESIPKSTADSTSGTHGGPSGSSVTNVRNVPNVRGVRGVRGVRSVPGMRIAPGVRSVPGVRNVPSVPGVPSAPGVTTIPSVPRVRSVPGVPNVSGVTSVHGVPSVPGKSNVSRVPSALGMASSRSDVPNMTGAPNVSGVPSVSTAHGLSSMPSDHMPDKANQRRPWIWSPSLRSLDRYEGSDHTHSSSSDLSTTESSIGSCSSLLPDKWNMLLDDHGDERSRARKEIKLWPEMQRHAQPLVADQKKKRKGLSWERDLCEPEHHVEDEFSKDETDVTFSLPKKGAWVMYMKAQEQLKEASQNLHNEHKNSANRIETSQSDATSVLHMFATDTSASLSAIDTPMMAQGDVAVHSLVMPHPMAALVNPKTVSHQLLSTSVGETDETELEREAKELEMSIARDKELNAMERRLMRDYNDQSSIDTHISDSSIHSDETIGEMEEKRPGFWERNFNDTILHSGYSSSGSLSSDMEDRITALSDGVVRSPSAASFLYNDTERVHPVKAQSPSKSDDFSPMNLVEVPSRAGLVEMPATAAAAGDAGQNLKQLYDDIGTMYMATMRRLHRVAWHRDPEHPSPIKDTFNSSATVGGGDAKMTVQPAQNFVEQEKEFFKLCDDAERWLGNNHLAYIDIFQGEENIILRTVEGHLFVVDVEIAKELELYKLELDSLGMKNFVQKVHRLPPLKVDAIIRVLLWSSFIQSQELSFESSSEESSVEFDSEAYESDFHHEPEFPMQDADKVSITSLLSGTSTGYEKIQRKDDASNKKHKKKKKQKTKKSKKRKTIPPSYGPLMDEQGSMMFTRKIPRTLVKGDPVLPADSELSVEEMALLHALLGSQCVGMLRDLLLAAEALGARELRDAMLRVVSRSSFDANTNAIRALLNPMVQGGWLPLLVNKIRVTLEENLTKRQGKYSPPYLEEYKLSTHAAQLAYRKMILYKRGQKNKLGHERQFGSTVTFKKRKPARVGAVDVKGLKEIKEKLQIQAAIVSSSSDIQESEKNAPSSESSKKLGGAV